MDREAEARIDRALVTRALCQEDRQAFDQLVRRHQGTVRAQLRQLCGADTAWADDLAQETFLQAWRKLGLFRGEARFSTWLYRIAHHCFLQARRRRGAEPAAEIDDDAEIAHPMGGVQDDGKGLRVDLHHAIGRLPEGERVVLLYHAHLGLSHEETAQVTGLPLGTVKTHALRGKARLRAWLDAYQSAEPTGALR